VGISEKLQSPFSEEEAVVWEIDVSRMTSRLFCEKEEVRLASPEFEMCFCFFLSLLPWSGVRLGKLDS
jgi:hypothetical protein